ncbi:MAG TPA: hypothetical protein VK894_00380 [Jiangellales bacterium]|nr:hypothetical protein [Jiangellales bacterium]
MTQTPGWGSPEGDGREPQPPYPGWSVEQPPPAPGWAAPGPGSYAPAGPPPGAPGPAGPQLGPGPAGPPPPGWAPSAPPPGAGWGWQPGPPALKPGVVPLRPLGIGELLDGAVTTLRQNPAAMLGLSAVVAALSQLVQLAAVWAFYRDLAVLEETTVTTGAEAVSLLSSSIGATAVSGVVTWLATVLLTGILTVVVSRAVLGERVSIGRAWQLARPQLLRLIGLTIVVALIVSAPFVLALLPAGLAALAGASGGIVASLAVLGVLLAIPTAVWLYVRVALSTPALMLETSADTATGETRRATVIGSLRRSSRLVAGSWWRVLGILLVANVLVWVISQVVAVPLTLLSFLVGGFSETGMMTLPGLALTGLAGIVATTITAPFIAGVTVLLYVDRRMRREGLDIALARAAGIAPAPPAAAPATAPATAGPAPAHQPMPTAGWGAGAAWSGSGAPAAPASPAGWSGNAAPAAPRTAAGWSGGAAPAPPWAPRPAEPVSALPQHETGIEAGDAEADGAAAGAAVDADGSAPGGHEPDGRERRDEDPPSS